MKTIKNITLRALILSMGMVLAFTSCMKDHSDPIKKEGKDVIFSINIPGKSSPTTRALTEEQENEVKSIEILLFDRSTKNVVGNPAFADVITTNGGDLHKKSFSVKLPEGTFDIMIFANSRAAFNGALIKAGDGQEATLAKLKAVMPATGWDATGAGAPIPMWGVKENVSVGTGVTISGIYMHRMLSRVDLSVTGNAAATGDFKLKNIKLYNVQKQGRIAPVMTNWNAAGLVNGSLAAGLATAPSLTGDGAYTAGISYQSVIATNEKSCTREMYLFEAVAAAAHGDLTAPYMTIEGEFNGITGWYRVDLADYSTMTYLDVLRNHLYKIEITKVSGTGFLDEEDAKKSRADNIVVTTTIWNEFTLGGTVFDGQHYLSINPQDIEYSKEPKVGAKLIIKTDNQLNAPTFVLSSSSTDKTQTITWIKNAVLGTAVINGDQNEYSLTYDVEQNDDGASRVGYIHVTVGRLTNVVRVRQTDKLDATIWITDMDGITPIESFNFFAAEGAQPDAKKYKIHWSPMTSKVTINVAAMGYDPIIWQSAALSPNEVTVMEDGSGMAEFTVQPKAILTGEMGSDAFYERQAMVSYRMVYAGQSIIKMLPMRHYVKNIRLVDEPFYLMDGKNKTVTVKSNVPWKLMVRRNTSTAGKAVVSEINGVTIDHIASGGDIVVARGDNNLPDGDVVRFTTVDDLINVAPSIFTGDFELEVVAEKSDANPDDKALFCVSGIIQPLSNSYLVKTEDTPILIPVKRANGYGIKSGKEFRQAGWPAALGDQITGEYTVDLVWTDKPHNDDPLMIQSIGDDGAVKMVVKAGSNADGYILVMPGKGQGNAVVSASVGGKIVWSWHIWVTDQLKSDGFAADNSNKGSTWMDRNLGATTKSATTLSTRGLYYQWGRKDPIPGANAISQGNGTVGCDYYFGDNTTPTPSKYVTWLSTGSSLANSIRTPLTSWDDWRGSLSGDGDNNSWGYNGDKTIFDPCPDGWRVPVNGSWSGISAKPLSNYGVTWDSHGGFYPAAGNRYSSGLSTVGSSGFYWSASPYATGGTYGYGLYFYSSGVSPSGYSNRNHGFSVRCVR